METPASPPWLWMRLDGLGRRQAGRHQLVDEQRQHLALAVLTFAHDKAAGSLPRELERAGHLVVGR